VGAGAASASAAGDSWGDPAVTVLESPEDSLADPIVKAAAFARRFIGRPGRVGRYSAAVLTRGFIGRTDPVVTLLQFRPEDSLGDPSPVVTLLQFRPEDSLGDPNPVVTLLQFRPEDSLGDPNPVVTLLQFRPEDSLGDTSRYAAGDSLTRPAGDSWGDPVLKFAACARRFIGRRQRSLLSCCSCPESHWVTRSLRWTLARRFFGGPAM